MSQQPISLRTNFVVFGALMLLLVLTVGAAYVDLEALHIGGLRLGGLHFPAAMLIAGVKAALIILYFMHVRYSNRLTWVFSGAAFIWLGILLALSLSDYLSRGWLDIGGK